MLILKRNFKYTKTKKIIGKFEYLVTWFLFFFYLVPISSSVTTVPSTIVKLPIPGKIRPFKISEPRAVAFIRQTFEFSNKD